MPHMIPDRLPSGVSQGEKKLFSILQKLPDDYIVYFENNSTGSYPDFIIIAPDLGFMVIEVKGWYAKHILGGDSNEICVNQYGKEQYQKHPVRQAREYMYKLMDFCQQHPNVDCLLHNEGSKKNRFIFPFGHFAVLSNIKSSELKEHQLGDLTSIFSSDKVVPRDVFLSWEDESFGTEQLVETLRSFFNPIWEFEPLTEEQINTLRGILHPETTIPIKPAEMARKPILKNRFSVQQLDIKQEQNARSIGQGHRIIYGVAGSGKTIILIARAKLVSSKYPDAEILLLCYNVVLGAYLKQVLQDYSNIKVRHFDEWSKDNGVTRRVDNSSGTWESESDEELGDRLLKTLENGAPDTERYDVVLIDEAQDFPANWFSCVLETMKDRYDGELIVVGDGAQGLYPRGKVSWKQIGINAQGRTIHKKFDLDKNYRNSKEILELAASFANSDISEDEDGIGAPLVDPDKCRRITGIKPVLIQAENRQAECDHTVEIVKNLIVGQWFDESIEPVAPEDIGIFYPLAYKKDKPILQNFIDQLNEITPTVWLNKSRDSRFQVCEPGIKVQTIHSAKGLQYKAVIVLWSDLLPTNFANTDEETEKRLLYVGLTRAEDFLAISSSRDSVFVSQIADSNKAVPAS